MKFSINFFFLIILISCNQEEKIAASDDYEWKLSWRMSMSAIEQNFEIANKQFDSLLALNNELPKSYLMRGLEIKSVLKRDKEIDSIVALQSEDFRTRVCRRLYMTGQDVCIGASTEQVTNEELQEEIEKMYVIEQALYGNYMIDKLKKYKVDTTKLHKSNLKVTQEANRNRVKDIIKNHGFPTKNQIGENAILSIFYFIKQSNDDHLFQKSQMKNLEIAVLKGDLDGSIFAYFYDRIRVRDGQKQLYGTQYSKYDRQNILVEIAPTENLESVNERRRKIGMMPIEISRKLFLKM